MTITPQKILEQNELQLALLKNIRIHVVCYGISCIQRLLDTCEG